MKSYTVLGEPSLTTSFSATPFFMSRPEVAVQMTSTSYSIAAATVAWKIGAPSSSPLRGSVFAMTMMSFPDMLDPPLGDDAPQHARVPRCISAP